MFLALFVGPWVAMAIGIYVVGGARGVVGGMIAAGVLVAGVLALGVFADWTPRSAQKVTAPRRGAKLRASDWYHSLYEDPQAWLTRNAGAGMMLLFVASRFVPYRFEPFVLGAAAMCAAVFWLFLILGMAGV